MTNASSASSLRESMTQAVALEVLKSGHNCFLTGPPGAGKSWLLRKFVVESRLKQTVAVTASTGIAGTHIGGMTLHSWAGLGVRDSYSSKDIADIADKAWVANRVRTTDVLVIDEISMLHRATFEAANAVCRKIRRNTAPFGGMQVVLCGDFFQLPPVSRDAQADFIYGSPSWHELALNVLYLSEQFRQTDDSLMTLLHIMRKGEVNQDSVEALMERLHADFDSGVTPTRLHTHNVNVDRVNEVELAKLPGLAKVFEMMSEGPAAVVEPLKKSCLAPARLQLKVGSSVMFVKNNLPEGYINGTLGTVIDFPEGVPMVQLNNGAHIVAKPQSWATEDARGRKIASIAQVPLRLAWAISVHKSQGMTLSAAEVDLSRAFVEGLGYVALSRVASMQDLKLLGINRHALSVSARALQIDEELQQASDAVLAGVVTEASSAPPPSSESLQLF